MENDIKISISLHYDGCLNIEAERVSDDGLMAASQTVAHQTMLGPDYTTPGIRHKAEWTLYGNRNELLLKLRDAVNKACAELGLDEQERNDRLAEIAHDSQQAEEAYEASRGRAI